MEPPAKKKNNPLPRQNAAAYSNQPDPRGPPDENSGTQSRRVSWSPKRLPLPKSIYISISGFAVPPKRGVFQRNRKRTILQRTANPRCGIFKKKAHAKGILNKPSPEGR